MTIELISEKEFNLITEIQKKYPVFTFENKGYEYITKNLSIEENKAKEEITSILKKHILGFSEFNNFRIRNNKIQLRIQYNYSLEKDERGNKYTTGRPFYGVGYLMLEELLNGF